MCGKCNHPTENITTKVVEVLFTEEFTAQYCTKCKSFITPPENK